MASPEQQRAAVLQACREHNVRVERIGNVWHLRSAFVDILAVDLALVRPIELRPYVPSR
ncbi:MAG TPA: hypothetical protein PL143_01515 [Rhodocyclaceae bacterium]|nr:hypothetical protein [Rhodocyclaceae bacterium]